jgi:predicted MPP superfamily phosphohydrolase
MVRIQYASDLHLDVNGIKIDEVIEPSADILVLAGDICEARHKTLMTDTIEWLESKFKRIFYVPGNHEFYGDTYIAGRNRLMNLESEKTKVLLSGHPKYDLGNGYNILGTTLWSFCPPEIMSFMEYTFSDFRKIKSFTGIMYNKLHNMDCMWLARELFLRNPDQKTLVVTHHPPLMDKSDPQYGGLEREINYMFGSSTYSNLVSAGNVSLYSNLKWLYGHTHYNPYGDPIFATNQYGYGDSECPDYSKSCVLTF